VEEIVVVAIPPFCFVINLATLGVQSALEEVVHSVAVRIGVQRVAEDPGLFRIGVVEVPPFCFRRIGNTVAVGVGAVGVGAQKRLFLVREAVAVGVVVARVEEVATFVKTNGRPRRRSGPSIHRRQRP
jgi:hypothetical protein